MQISINSTQGNKLYVFTQEKNWYRNGVVGNSVVKHTPVNNIFYTKH
jgi:hypothetical protein